MTLNEKAAWLAEHLLEWEWVEPNTIPRCHWKDQRGLWHEPDWWRFGNGMLEIIWAMRERGFDWFEADREFGDRYSVWFKEGERFQGIAETLPAAVIEAAYAALEKSDE